MLEYISQTDARSVIALVDAILSNPGHTMSVHDGEAWSVRRSQDRDAILNAMGETELDDVRVRDEDTNIIGWFRLIYGNGPGELIADCSDNDYCGAIANLINV
jgi:azurin